jgi:hypothetical protein
VLQIEGKEQRYQGGNCQKYDEFGVFHDACRPRATVHFVLGSIVQSKLNSG